MTHTKKTLFSIISLLLLANCKGQGHPKMLSFTPASVVIDYTDTDLHGATSLAQQYCSSINKDAQYVSKDSDDAWGLWQPKLTAFFNCVSRDKNDHSGAQYHGGGGVPIINNFHK